MPLPSLREQLRRHCLEEPSAELRSATAGLEAALEAAFRKAEYMAQLHPPFLQAAELPPGATAAMAPPALGKLLDVGNVRVDGGSLWPDEATESPMQPIYALMSLEALVGSTVEVPTWAPAEPGGDSAASGASPFMTDGTGEPAAFV